MKLVWKMITLTLHVLYFLAIGLPILMYLEKPPVSTYARREIDPKTLKVAPGEEVLINISAAVANKECDGKVVRTITDSTGRSFDFAPEPRPLLETYTVPLTVPLGAYPGEAEYSATIYWSCNFVQKFFPTVIVQKPLKFEIIPAAGQLPNPEQQGIFMVPQSKSDAFALTNEGD